MQGDGEMEEEEGDRKRQTEGSRNVFVKDHFHPTRLASYTPQSPRIDNAKIVLLHCTNSAKTADKVADNCQVQVCVSFRRTAVEPFRQGNRRWVVWHETKYMYAVHYVHLQYTCLCLFCPLPLVHYFHRLNDCNDQFSQKDCAADNYKYQMPIQLSE